MKDIQKKIIFLVLVIGIGLIGCSSKNEKTLENNVVIWLVGSERQAETIRKVSKQFTEETGIKIFCESLSWHEAHTKYLTAIAGGVAPDIGTMGLTWGMEFGKTGALVDLRKEFGEEISTIEKKIFPGILASTRHGDKNYGIPFDFTEQVMYYRTDIIKQPPETWDELLDLLKELKKDNKGMLIDWGSLDWIGFSPFLWQANGTYFNEDYTSVTLATPEATRAITFFSSLYEHGVPKTYIPIEQGLKNGDYPIAIAGSWKIISLLLLAPNIADKWEISMLPQGPSGKRTAFIGGRVLSIFEMSKMKKQSWQFIKFLFKPQVQVEIYKDLFGSATLLEDSYLPPNMDSWGNLPMEDKYKKILEAQAKDAQGPPAVASWDTGKNHINHAIQKIVLKGADPILELKIAQEAIQKEMEK
ncbi:ABC transporter substrate-binding protein [Candidatus Omnitrophus magneticus]|uniref:ABC transporter substrate-binding protein n=1 Tax=Candidatus Omnitrophus magneticus TaxID=1609969 RepID=A0A0F0CR03_9BACT|nr:ABC transporter substrate-binding protein [Candidatus Omnitrophus magneticus]